MIRGIDVSKWQGNINFQKVKDSGISFVIIRAGYGKLPSQKDKCFEENYCKAKASGLDVGVYWYSYAMSVDEAREEAKACLSVIKGKQFEYPVYFDLEEQKQFSKGREFCDSIVNAFCGELEKNGYFAGLYISCSPLERFISESTAKKYALWVAEYNSRCRYNADYGMWQYSSKGKVNGIGGNYDMNYCYKNYPSIIKNGGFNGYGKKKSVDEIAKEVIDGKWSNGEERKKKLSAEGYDWKVVQKKVNELLK